MSALETGQLDMAASASGDLSMYTADSGRPDMIAPESGHLVSGVIRAGVPMPHFSGFPSIADFNEDGWLEPFGFLNNGDGTFNTSPSLQLNAILANYPGRINRDARVFDIDGDGHLDAVWNVYTDPSVTGSFTLVLFGDGTGAFTRVEEWHDVRGYGETIVSADFNNDGLNDVFIPVYTHVDGSDSNYLFLNQGNGTFGENVALDWGVGLSFLPAWFRVEGAQAADVDFDGRLDLFVGSHMFINEGTSFTAQPLTNYTFDEGSSLFDYDNDGDFDLVLRGENLGPRLFESVDGQFIDRGILTGSETILGFGINVADLDGNGWQDIIVGGEGCVSIFFNFEGEFTRYFVAANVGDIDQEIIQTFGEAPCCGICQHGGPGVCEAIAVADFDGNGTLDIISKAGTLMYFANNLSIGDVLSLTVLSATGAEDQYGRSVRLTPHSRPDLVMARAVESGSGYLSQNQYEMLIGLPVGGAYDVEITFASGAYRFVASARQTISAFADGRVSIIGSADADVMGGGTGADILSGGIGDDLFLASLGADHITGGEGTDTVDYSAMASALHADLAAETATIGAATQTLQGIENLVGTAFDDVLSGNAGANHIIGGAGNDSIDGRGGADTMAGGTGNDIYFVDDIADGVTEAAGEGEDEVRTTLASYILAANVENVTGLLDTGQVLEGNALANRFTGGAGADTFIGGGGNDRYLVGEGDIVVEHENGGDDEVLTALASYALAAHVERLTGTASTGQSLVGNAQNNILSGGSGADTFAGGAGDDLYFAGLGDVIVEAENEGFDEVRTALATFHLSDHIEQLTGTATISQHLYGNSGANIISGGTAGDTFEGGLGDDIYYVGLRDVVIEGVGGGIDEVRTSLDVYTLTANVENLTGTGVIGQKLVGNELGNVLRSNSAQNTLIGRGGDDVYWINNTRTSIVETANNGYDTIRSSVNFILDIGISIEVIAAADANATTALSFTGNALVNTLIGNAGNNSLNGGGGADTLIGLGGNDVYIMDEVGITVVEAAGEGDDIILTSVNYIIPDTVFVESLSTRNWAATTAINLTGNQLANIIVGNAGVNIIDGGTGADQMQGREGDDTYIVDHVSDRIYENVGEGNDTILAKISYALTAGVSVETLAAWNPLATTALNLTGNEFANHLIGSAGDNILDGGAGADVMTGGLGNDTYVVDDAGDQVTELAGEGSDTIRTKISYTLGAGNSIETLSAFDVASLAALGLTGNELANTLIGNAGANTLDGGAGADVMRGGAGDDIYIVDNAGDQVVELSGGGNDTVRTTVSYVLGAGVWAETLTAFDLTSFADLSLTGNELANTLIGNAGANTLDGGAGIDVMTGGAGDDVYIVDNIADQIVELADEGNDTVRAKASYTIGAGVSIETLAAWDPLATTAMTLTGNELANRLIGNAGANTLDGGAGADVMTGGLGNDIYVVDDAGDQVTELAGEGSDTIRTKIDYTLGAGNSIETLTAFDLASLAALSLTGNELANTLIGNAGANTLDGGAGADVMTGGAGDDIYIVDNISDRVNELAGEGNDTVRTMVNYTLGAGVSVETLAAWDAFATTALTLTGNELANTLIGNAGANIFFGGGGADTFSGLGGNDRYYIDNSSTQIIEGENDGNDILLTSVNYVLAAGVYVESLSARDWAATTAINITGNEIANTIVGNAGANILDGGGGADILQGREGDDIYIVDHVSDRVYENAGEGNDTIRTRVNYALTAGLSIETLSAFDLASTGALNLTGNELANTLIGNAGANILDGGAGNDIMRGGAGNDTYIVDALGDQVIELAGDGNDTIRAKISYTLAAGLSIETLAAWDASGTTALTFTGNELVNTLIGNAGANIFFGGGGADTFSGLGGNDRYYIDNSGTQIIEGATGGNDILLTSVDYVLAAGVYVESLSTRDWAATTAINITGNEIANTIVGNAGANILDGGAGADILQGREGDDVYIVDNILDQVYEIAGQGNDTVRTKVSYSLDPGMSIETLAAWDALATTALTLTGNALVNTLIGNAGANMFFGGGGADTFSGLGGDDRYYIDDSAIQIIEGINDGANDILLTSVNYTLANGVYVENLSARDWAATTAINITGNEISNAIVGNAGANILDGGGGADRLMGREGDDTYIVDDALDRITELVGEGNDLVRAKVSYVLTSGISIETLAAWDAEAAVALDLTGNEQSNTLIGNAGANYLNGAGGDDALYGLGGNDILSQYCALSGRVFMDGGDGSDTYRLYGASGPETFTIYTRAAGLAEVAGLVLRQDTEVVVLRNGVVVAELDNIENLTFNSQQIDVHAAAYYSGAVVGGDTLKLVGNFAETSFWHDF